jgi:hypothetical protein
MAFVEPASDVDWRLAMEREFVIRPLAAEAKLTSEQMEEAMLRLSLGRSVLYKLVHRYKQRPQTSSSFLGKGAGPTTCVFDSGAKFVRGRCALGISEIRIRRPARAFQTSGIVAERPPNVTVLN